MREIKLSLTVEDVNHILQGLGDQPYAKVYTLVGKIQQQAAEQIQSENQNESQNQGSALNSPAHNSADAPAVEQIHAEASNDVPVEAVAMPDKAAFAGR